MKYIACNEAQKNLHIRPNRAFLDTTSSPNSLKDFNHSLVSKESSATVLTPTITIATPLAQRPNQPPLRITWLCKKNPRTAPNKPTVINHEDYYARKGTMHKVSRGDQRNTNQLPKEKHLLPPSRVGSKDNSKPGTPKWNKNE